MNRVSERKYPSPSAMNVNHKNSGPNASFVKICGLEGGCSLNEGKKLGQKSLKKHGGWEAPCKGGKYPFGRGGGVFVGQGVCLGLGDGVIRFMPCVIWHMA